MSRQQAQPSTSPPTKASLLKWWKVFSRPPSPTPPLPPPPASALLNTTTSTQRPPTSRKLYRPHARGLDPGQSGEGRVFGVPLEQSLEYASVAISAVGPDSAPYIYGYVPIVVAKCGMYLKETATATEGIFRVSGSNKRINELQEVFDTPPRYGKDLDWAKYTQHDAASLLRRYLNTMPDPVIPQDLYSLFTSVLQKHLAPQELVSSYKHLISLLPPASRYLLLYLLDFLAVFARASPKNLMTASNLAVVFQPGLVSSRKEGQGDWLGFPGVSEAGGRVSEHGRGKEVLEFLIERQEEFMVGLEPPPKQQKGEIPVVAGLRLERKGKGVGGLPSTSLVGGSEPGRGEGEGERSASGQEQGKSRHPKSETTLERKGSDKSVERRRVRIGTGAEGGKVKRSRTLPGRKSDASKTGEDKKDPERLRKKRGDGSPTP